MDPTRANINVLRSALKARRISVPELVEAHLQRIAARDATVCAFAHVDAEGARKAAARAPQGPLGGLPFGAKDVLDTCDMPTGQGSALFAGNQPLYDAGSVARMRQAGAILLGKTATAEFAGIAPAATTHPADPRRTPGGSSSGSAAAVADGMAVFALGTQTGGSVLRPAAFCGVAGFKPTFGLWPVSGMLPAAHSFDTVGVIARSAEDLGVVHATMMRSPEPDPVEDLPAIALCRTHLWDTVAPSAIAVLETALARLSTAGAPMVPAGPSDDLAALTAHRATINAFERAGNMAGLSTGRDRFKPESEATYARGLEVTAAAYLAARRALDVARNAIGGIFGEAGILLAPVVPDVAPMGLESTGDPRLQEIWSMLHCPVVTVPFGTGANDLPLGVQLVGRPYEDERLLALARRLERLGP